TLRRCRQLISIWPQRQRASDTSNSLAAVVAHPAIANGDVFVARAIAIGTVSKARKRHHGHKAERIAAPTARMVNTAQVRSGHLGSASGSHSGSDMAPAPPVVLGMSDTSIAKVWIRSPPVC